MAHIHGNLISWIGMGIGNKHLFVMMAIGLVIMAGCNDHTDDKELIRADFQILPDSGFTTTRFLIQINTENVVNEEDPVFYRIDWDGDGIWNLDYTTNPKQEYRFFKAGTYRIVIEARKLSGVRDTASRVVTVRQGYSPPYPILQVIPDSGNIYQSFFLNAGDSYDDEENSAELLFRWDFDGDGLWETSYDTIRYVYYQFEEPGQFKPTVDVMDLTGRSRSVGHPIIVNLLNDSVICKLKVEAGFATIRDTIHLDATGSLYKGKPEVSLLYSWDVFDDGLWETQPTNDPALDKLITIPGLHKIRLRVTEPRGLYMDLVDTIRIFPEDTPPVPRINLLNSIGNVYSEYAFSSIGTYDRETRILDLLYEWDTNHDGVFESVLRNQRTVTCRFFSTGKYPITLKVTDDHLNSVEVVDTVRVYSGSHETGVLTDSKGDEPESYSIVKIGELWWMQENLNLIVTPGSNDPGVNRQFYGKNPSWCKTYGGLYDSRALAYFRGICPKGWRLPTAEEFTKVFEAEGKGNLASLLLGGSTELHFLLSGYKDMRGNSLGFGYTAHFWISDKTQGQGPMAWYINNQTGEIRKVGVSPNDSYSIRCVRLGN